MIISKLIKTPILIVGLGNMGFSGTRHNLGPMFSEFYLIIQRKTFLRKRLKILKYLFSICPAVMNSSGSKIKKVYEELSCKSLIILFDDMKILTFVWSNI